VTWWYLKVWEDEGYRKGKGSWEGKNLRSWKVRRIGHAIKLLRLRMGRRACQDELFLMHPSA